MEIENNILVDDLLQRMERCTKAALAFRNLSTDQLQFKTDEKWSALECLEHLNLYGDFYLVEIEKQILKSTRKAMPMKFKSGLLGNYFANLMKVKDGMGMIATPWWPTPKRRSLVGDTDRGLHWR